MSAHIKVREALRGLAGGQVFPLVADEDTAPPYVVFQAVGGDPQEFLSGDKPQKKQRRVQINVWAKSIIEAGAIAEQVEDAFRATADLQADVLAPPIDTYDETTKYRGTMQEFYLYC